VGVYLVQRTIKAIFSTVTSSAAMMRSPSFSRSVESRTTMNSPLPVTPRLSVSKNSVECSPSSASCCYSFAETSPAVQMSPSLSLSPTNSMAMKITYGRPQPPPGSSGKRDLSPRMKPFRPLVAYCGCLVVAVAVVEKYMVPVRKKKIAGCLSLVFFFLPFFLSSFPLFSVCHKPIQSFGPRTKKNNPRTEQ